MATGPYWYFIRPDEGGNLLLNPSGEYGTQGWGTIQAGTIGTTSAVQRFGAWAGSVAPTSNGTAGAFFGTATVGNGTVYTASAFVQGANGIPYQLQVETTDGATKYGSANFTGGGTWQRHWVTFSQTADTTVRVVVKKNSNADTSAFYVDAVNLWPGSAQTYVDGDQEGCYWLGLPHYSQSRRSGSAYQGGSIVSLASLGLIVKESFGFGMPPLEVTKQSYAIVDGAEYQRSRRADRAFVLQCTLLGTAWEDLHATRQEAIDAFGPDRLATQQPIRFFYTGAGGTVAIDAVYEDGLGHNDRQGFSEETPIQFIAHSPTWFSPFDQGTALAPRTALGSANAIVRRDPYGRWGTMGAHGTSVNGTVDTLLMAPTGTLFVGGRIVSVDGTVSRGLAMYFPSTNRFGSMGGTLTPGAAANVASLAYAPWGSLYVAGQFGGISGTATRFLAQWNGGYGSLIGGTVDARVFSIKLSQTGTMFVAGGHLTANGTTAPRLSMWMPSGSMGTLVGQGAGTIDNTVTDIAFGIGFDPPLYFTGLFGSAGGTAMYAIGQWRNGTFGTMGAGLQDVGGLAQGNALAVGANGAVTAGGNFGTVGSLEGTNIGQWDGVSYVVPGGGLGTSSVHIVNRLAVHPKTGEVYAVGAFNGNSNSLPFPDGMAVYNGYTWFPLDIDTAIKVSSGGGANAVAFGPDNSVYIGGLWTGTAYAASVAQIANVSKAYAQPTLRLRNTGSGTARIYQFTNNLRNDRVLFNYVMQPGETARLTLVLGSIKFESDFRGNLYHTILPASVTAQWKLTPGTNWVGFFCDSDNVRADLYWRPRHDSADAGSVF